MVLRYNRAVFNRVLKVILGQFLNQFEAKPKSIVTWSHVFSRAYVDFLCRLRLLCLAGEINLVLLLRNLTENRSILLLVIAGLSLHLKILLLCRDEFFQRCAVHHICFTLLFALFKESLVPQANGHLLATDSHRVALIIM